METIETKVYQFEELSDDAKLKAIENCRYLDVELFDWYFCVCDDIEYDGIKINEFDIDRKNSIDITLQYNIETVLNKILSNNSDSEEKYKIADNYKTQYDAINAKYNEDEDWEFDREIDQLTDEFIQEIGEEYLSILRRQYEYLISDEAVIEYIINNEYVFTEEGENLY